MLHVIGIGSPFGDDSIGLLLIDELRRTEILQPYLGQELELLQLDRPGAALLTQLERMDRVVIIDAVVSGGVVGQLHCWSDPATVEQNCGFCSSHGFGLAQSLSLGRALGSLPPQLQVFGVEISPPEVDVVCAHQLRHQLRQQLPVLVVKVAAAIVAHLSRIGGPTLSSR